MSGADEHADRANGGEIDGNYTRAVTAMGVLHTDTKAVVPPATAQLFTDARAMVANHAPADVARHVREIVEAHDRWRGDALHLLAAEGPITRRTRELLACDLAARVAEGFPGAKDTTTSPQVANAFVDELEALYVALASNLFGATYVEWRPTSNTMANAVALFALTRPGDVIVAQAMSAGGNASYHRNAVAGLRGLEVHDMPGTPLFGVDLDALRQQVRALRPKLIIFGGTKVLFPYPTREIRELADEVGAYVVYDGAHVGPLIAAGLFGDPLREGAHVLTTGTHKLMGGPVGGLVLTSDPDIARRLHAQVFPAFMQTRDQNKYAAGAHALAELTQWCSEYANQTVANARALGAALSEHGLEVLGAEAGYTRSHQVIIDAGAAATSISQRCAAVHILLGPTNIYGERAPDASGIRTSAAYTTRQGMAEEQMREIASLISDVALERAPADQTAHAVSALVSRFPTMHFGL